MHTKLKKYCESIVSAIEEGKICTREELNKFKLTQGKKLGIEAIPSNPDILGNSRIISAKARKLLSIKPRRTLSGVAPVAIMTKPINCPHGTCIYCPGGPNSFFGDVPQSYTGNEPATMRAINNNYNSYLQTMNRLAQYYATAHNPEKLEVIIMGGTFPSFPQGYQEEFISECFQAVNDFSETYFSEKKFLEKKFNENFFLGNKNFSEEARKKLSEKILEANVEREHKRNEKAVIRIVTMCIETKPDWCKEKEINEMLRLGTTRVELGAQTIYDEILKYTNRGHTIKDTIEAARLLKDSGLKVTYHMMPGQPLSTKEKDIEMFKEIFENPDYRPDGLKIYPCMVMPGTALEKLYKNGKYKPLGNDEAAEIIAEATKYIPYYCRTHRIQRDIPAKLAVTQEDGITVNNLRQIVEQKTNNKKIISKDIRERESGISQGKGAEINYDKIKLIARDYKASKGEEIFISYEDTENDILLGFCRLRKPFEPFRKEFTENSTCIRELHVFGSEVGIGKKNTESQQHRGFGQKLVEEAERLSIEKFDAKKMLIISGVGAREYYSKKLGYGKDGPYMSKKPA